MSAIIMIGTCAQRLRCLQSVDDLAFVDARFVISGLRSEERLFSGRHEGHTVFLFLSEPGDGRSSVVQRATRPRTRAVDDGKLCVTDESVYSEEVRLRGGAACAVRC